ncbi:MAG: glycoside hydrolase family 127 protein [Sedimentisphaerales bacterium]|nr:glycoside hydrolase family 127 protein [Sedimentisphaerales bacterium]
MTKKIRVVVLALIVIMMECVSGAAEEVRVLSVPQANRQNDYYVSNRAPLLASSFVKLPIGAIKPKGWVRRQLELQAEGFVGRLTEISRFLTKENNAWLSPKGEGKHPWEEMPYWLKGFGDLGYVLGDERIIKETRIWIEGALNSQREDGYFGPRANLLGKHGPGGLRKKFREKPDLWPHMVMVNALQSYYEYSGDKRVLDLLSKYFRWQMTVPDEDFLPPYWQQQRGSDNLASVYWLYNLTGEKFLLEVAEKTHRNTADWMGRVANWHNVNIAQAFRAPAIYYQQSKVPIHLQAAERNYNMVWGVYGQVPGGMFGGDENCRKGYYGPRQAVETCGMVEFMLSCEMLLKITGETKWADRCEDVAFNMFPASMTADLKALHYLTAPNMILCDQKNKSPGIQNKGAMFAFNPHGHRCCQHNVSHGWPYYAEHLWLATPDNGLAAVLYAPCEVTAKVGNGSEVTIKEETLYPFEEKIKLTVTTAKQVQFPLYLRVPKWCSNPKVTVNKKAVKVYGRESSYIVLERLWKNGDTVSVMLPTAIKLRYWVRNNNCVSVDRGPLTYSLKIGEKYVRYGGTDKWPAWEIHPTSDWNYGLVLDDTKPLDRQFMVKRREWPSDEQPFKVNAAPIELTVKAKKIRSWKKDHLGLVGKMQPSPVKSEEPAETVTLIPMGCARLRISAFPVTGTGSTAHEWSEKMRNQ